MTSGVNTNELRELIGRQQKKLEKIDRDYAVLEPLDRLYLDDLLKAELQKVWNKRERQWSLVRKLEEELKRYE